MKKFISLCTLAVVLMTSCGKNFITPVHNSSEPYSEYFTNESRAFEALVAAYDPLNWFDYFYQYNAIHFISDIMADDIYCGGSNDGDQPVLVKAHYYASTPTDCCNQIWTIAYSGINRACAVLENMDKVPGMSDELKTLYKTEAEVLKCYYYNILWKFWGNIPYYDKNLVSPYFTKQLTADEVYKNNITALEHAISQNVLPMKVEAGKEGRISLAMAYMLYAEMVMYQNDEERYDTALRYMKDIKASNKYTLEPDYAGIFLESGEWCRESIWEINYFSEGASRDWGNPIRTGGTVHPVLTGIPGASKEFVDGWGFGGVAKSAYDMFDEGDIRRDGGILNIETYLTPSGEKETCTPRWETEGFYNLKYIARLNGNHGYKGDANMNHGNNFRVYRYAETLLNAAELSVLTGGDGSSYLKEVRDRAKCKDSGVGRADIIQERHKEFVGEGKRYWDLVRSGLAQSVLTSANHTFRPNDWTPNKKYWPIPQTEIDKDPDLKQNTAYNN